MVLTKSSTMSATFLTLAVLVSRLLLVNAAYVPDVATRDDVPLKVGPLEVQRRVPLSYQKNDKNKPWDIARGLNDLDVSAFEARDGISDISKRARSVRDLFRGSTGQWNVQVRVGAAITDCVVDSGHEWLIMRDVPYSIGPEGKNLNLSKEVSYGTGDLTRKINTDIYVDTVELGSHSQPFTVRGVGVGAFRSATFPVQPQCIMGLAPSTDPLAPAAPSLVPTASLQKDLQWNSITVLDLNENGGFIGFGAGDGSITQFAGVTAENLGEWKVASNFIDNSFRHTLIDSSIDRIVMSEGMLRSTAGAIGLQVAPRVDGSAYNCIGGPTAVKGKDLQIGMQFGSAVDARLKPASYWSEEVSPNGLALTKICSVSGLTDDVLIAGIPLFLSAIVALDYNNRRVGFFARPST